MLITESMITSANARLGLVNLDTIHTYFWKAIQTYRIKMISSKMTLP